MTVNGMVADDDSSITRSPSTAANEENSSSTHSASTEIPSPWRVFAKTLTGRLFTLQTGPECSVWEAKILIEDAMGVPAQYMRFTYGGRALYDHMKLNDYGIARDATIFLTLQLR